MIKRRKADEQDRRVDISTINPIRSVTPPLDIADDAFDEFIAFSPDSDSDEGFYPAPELESWYEEEEEVPDQVLGNVQQQALMMQVPVQNEGRAGGSGGWDDSGNVSEEAGYLPEDEGRFVPKKKTRGRKRREET